MYDKIILARIEWEIGGKNKLKWNGIDKKAALLFLFIAVSERVKQWKQEFRIQVKEKVTMMSMTFKFI